MQMKMTKHTQTHTPFPTSLSTRTHTHTLSHRFKALDKAPKLRSMGATLAQLTSKYLTAHWVSLGVVCVVFLVLFGGRCVRCAVRIRG